MIRLSDGLVAKAQDGASATLIALPAYVRDTALDYQMADFSSQGPTMGQNIYPKPDVVAPGHNVISSLPAAYCDGNVSCWGVLSGTSMATPHMAGLAALVKNAHPAWSAAEIRSAIVNTAQEGVLRTSDTNTPTDDAVIVGAGLADAHGSVNAKISLDPVSVYLRVHPGDLGPVEIGNAQRDQRLGIVGNVLSDDQRRLDRRCPLLRRGHCHLVGRSKRGRHDLHRDG